MASYYCIINPLAGYGEVNRVYNRLIEEIDSLKLDAEFAKTISPGDGTHLAKVALKKGYRTIICIGGDGTVHEVLNGIGGHAIRIGIVPFGLANLLAKRLGIPTDWRAALRLIAKGTTRKIDVGQGGDRYFLTAAGVGLEAEMASQRLLLHTQRMSSPFNALRAASVRLTKVPPLPLSIMIDEKFVLTVRAYSASIVNSAHVFQESLPVYQPDPQDRKLNLFVVSHLARGERIASLVRGKLLPWDESLTALTASRIQFLTPNDLPIQADGEIIRRTTPLEFTVAPFQQEIIAPPEIPNIDKKTNKV